MLHPVNIDGYAYLIRKVLTPHKDQMFKRMRQSIVVVSLGSCRSKISRAPALNTGPDRPPKDFTYLSK